MKKWHQGHNKYFIHLEHVAKLPESYTGFLKEIRRRKSFNKVALLDCMSADTVSQCEEVLLPYVDSMGLSQAELCHLYKLPFPSVLSSVNIFHLPLPLLQSLQLIEHHINFLRHNRSTSRR